MTNPTIIERAEETFRSGLRDIHSLYDTDKIEESFQELLAYAKGLEILNKQFGDSATKYCAERDALQKRIDGGVKGEIEWSDQRFLVEDSKILPVEVHIKTPYHDWHKELGKQVLILPAEETK